MAEGGRPTNARADAASEASLDRAPGGPRTISDYEPLVTAVGAALDFGAMLAIADLLPVMVAYYDRDCIFRFINKPFADWLGIPRKEILGKHSREIIGGSAFDERQPMIEQVLQGQRTFFAARFDHPARGPVAVQSDYIPWSDSSGAVHGVIVMVTDVTEHRVAERSLRESQARFRRIANSAPVMIWVTRADGTRDFVNDAYVEFTGLPPEEARLLDWRSRIHPDDFEAVTSHGEARILKGEAVTFEARIRRHDGEYRWVRSVSQPRLGPDGELVGYIGVANDITVAKEAELELRRQVEERTRELALSEARFRSVFDTILEVLVLMKPDGTVVELNRKEAPWRAENAREAVGRKMWDAPTLELYPDQKKLLKRAVAYAAAGNTFEQEVRLDREGAATAYLDVTVQPVRDDSGEIVYLLFEARDVTELKTAQEQLRQSQKMEALGQLTGGIAHDFNNLLTVVVGGLDIIAKRADDDKLRLYAENALAAAERGARLTGQLLAFSRVQKLEVAPTLVAPLMQNMRSLLRNVLGPGIEKRFDLDDDGMPIMADATQLEVAVLNLAINARDAMPRGGVLTFASKRVEVKSDPHLEDGDYIELTIADTGTGMPPEVVERAFEPFFTTKEVGKGTGLGLSMVYGMARQSGGIARIESTVGKGTAVKLLFRKADEQAVPVQATPEEPESDLRSEPASILVIDDDPDVRTFVAATLEEQGFRVRQASDGKQGLAEIERQRPDLVIVDFIMPDLSGAEVANRIRATQPDQSILFVSGYSETEAIKRTAPDAPLLAKPFRAEALDKAVRGALAGR